MIQLKFVTKHGRKINVLIIVFQIKKLFNKGSCKIISNKNKIFSF